MTLPYVRRRAEVRPSRRLQPAVAEPAPARVQTSSGRTSPEWSRPGSGRAFAGAVASIAAALLLGFVVVLLPLGTLKHHRDQGVKYDEFRLALAEGTAPVGQRDEFGRLLALGTPVALITIPRIGLEEVVSEGTSAHVLRSGPGHRRDTMLPGQPGTAVVMARRAAFGGPFGRLSELGVGDAITVVTGQGRFRFVVTGMRHPGDLGPRVQAAGAGRLTLVTTSGSSLLPDGALRVDADLRGAAQPASAREGGISATEVALATDPGAWTRVLLWGELLLALALGLTWLRVRWGRWQTWVVGLPALLAVGVATATQACALLPNLV